MIRLLTRRAAPALAFAAALVLAMPAGGGAQVARSPESRLASRLDAPARAQVLAQVDSARQHGLPTSKLVDLALEGASKRAPAAQIVRAVQRLRGALSQARLALGRGSSVIEIETGASALQAQVGPEVLASLRRARPDRSLTVPLAVLTDLVAFGVPTDTAARTVIALARAEDAALLAFQRDVERDISVGALPGVAASVRAAGLERADAELLNTGTTVGPTSDSDRRARPPRRP